MFSSVFVHQNPGSGLDPDPDPDSLECWIRIRIWIQWIRIHSSGYGNLILWSSLSFWFCGLLSCVDSTFNFPVCLPFYVVLLWPQNFWTTAILASSPVISRTPTVILALPSPGTHSNMILRSSSSQSRYLQIKSPGSPEPVLKGSYLSQRHVLIKGWPEITRPEKNIAILNVQRPFLE